MKLHGLWNELPKCCQQCQNIKPGDINQDIFECSKNLILPTKKNACLKQIKKREHIKDRFKRFLVEINCIKVFNSALKKYPLEPRPSKISPCRIIMDTIDIDKSYIGKIFWAILNSQWQEVIRTEYPEYIPK